jgi:CheY-like chemotaxis protein
MSKKRIMIVDDEAPLTRLLKLSLERTGRYVVQVENRAQEAVRSAESFLPDLVLMDVMMPEIDGGALAAQFQTRPPLKHVPIVFLTAAVKRKEVQGRRGEIGGLPFLAKPIALQEITRCLEHYLGAEMAPPNRLL